MRLLLAALLVITSLALDACGRLPALGNKLAPAAIQAQKAKGVYRSGDRTLYVLPEAGEACLLDAINGAKKNVRLEIYILTEQNIVDALIAAKARGVDVQVMIEPRPYNPGAPGAPLPVNKPAIAALEAGGVPVKETSPAYKFTHAKFMSVDDAVTFVSTANFTRSGLNVGGGGSREYIVADREPGDVAEFVRVFQADMAREPYQPRDPDSVLSPVNARSRIFDLIRNARQELLIADEVAGDPELDALIASKVAQGVHVRALLAYYKAEPGKPLPGNHTTALKWLAVGARVRFQSKPMLHAKAVIADGRVMYVGSENLTTNSLDRNREVGLLLDEPALVAPVLSTTEGDWERALPVPPIPQQH